MEKRLNGGVRLVVLAASGKLCIFLMYRRVDSQPTVTARGIWWTSLLGMCCWHVSMCEPSICTNCHLER